ncbi:TraB/VirB10 family protein [Pandoraea commovens]|uniref:TraB/VirB10 family protein n=1 Tax=Pandoraea commovens TaxID=2508289 RepID=A0ABY5Q961_9BURK|nr:TraB/VirB10 family protein [Pandoraea commovens]UVA77164.1 TraB/VirB10 family protein [Pandoraea commovens]
METPSFISQKKQEWQDMPPMFRALIAAVLIGGSGYILYKKMTAPAPAPSTASALPTQGAASSPVSAQAAPAPQSFAGVLPTTSRNQGLEDLSAEIRALGRRMDAMAQGAPGGNSAGTQMGNITVVTPAGGASAASAAPGSDATAPSGPGKDLPAAVNFDRTDPNTARAAAPNQGAGFPEANPAPAEPSRPMMVADAVKQEPNEDEGSKRPDLVLPKYTGIEAVMLTGINAMPSGSNGGAAGDVKKMEEVGAPFVSRVKGLAIMPNSWKSSDLQNCFIGGGAVAVISAERAYATSQAISCIFSDGEVFEGKVNAYAVDIDGTLGLAGRVVNKQGTMLMQSALSGMAAGLGSALAPQAVPSYNTNTANGQQQSYTLPNPAYLAGTAVGQGINHAASQLSQFYLNFAKETFPVVEVTAGTRVTWILREPVVLKKRTANKDAQK